MQRGDDYGIIQETPIPGDNERTVSVKFKHPRVQQKNMVWDDSR